MPEPRLSQPATCCSTSQNDVSRWGSRKRRLFNSIAVPSDLFTNSLCVCLLPRRVIHACSASAAKTGPVAAAAATAYKTYSGPTTLFRTAVLNLNACQLVDGALPAYQHLKRVELTAAADGRLPRYARLPDT